MAYKAYSGSYLALSITWECYRKVKRKDDSYSGVLVPACLTIIATMGEMNCYNALNTDHRLFGLSLEIYIIL